MKQSDVLRDVEHYGKRAVGRSEFCGYLRGKNITRGQAVRAKCYDCMWFYGDGLVDCKIKRCPLYPFMPYRDDNKMDKGLKPPDVAPGDTVRGLRVREGVDINR